MKGGIKKVKKGLHEAGEEIEEGMGKVKKVVRSTDKIGKMKRLGRR